MKRFNKVLSGMMVATMMMALVGCGASESASTEPAATEEVVEEVAEEATEETVEEATAEEETVETEEATEESTEATAEYEYEVGPQIQEILDRGTLIVGIDSGYVPFCFTDPATGVSYGVNVNVAQRVADVLGVKLEIVSEGFAAVLSDLAVDKIDLVAAMVVNTEERAEIMDFSHPLRNGYDYILVRTEDADKYTSKEALAGATVVANNGSVQLNHAQELEGVSVVATESASDAALQVVSGTADVMVTSDANGLMYEIGYDGALTMVKDVYWENTTASLAVNKGDSDLLDLVNQIIDNEIIDNVEEMIEEETERGVELLGVGK